MAFFAAAFGPMWIVADPDQPITAVASVNKAVRACSENCLTFFDLPFATGLLVVNVAIFFVRQSAELAFAVGTVVAKREETLKWGSLSDGRVFARQSVCPADTVIGGAAVVFVVVLIALVIVIFV